MSLNCWEVESERVIRAYINKSWHYYLPLPNQYSTEENFTYVL